MKIKKRIRSILRSTKDLFVSPKKKFNMIYRTNFWGDTESISGPGSKIEVTARLRSELSILLKNFDVRSIVDAPCGDFNWMKLMDLGNIDYCGIDIVEELIDKNNKNYKRDGINFILRNILEDKLPCADIIICRDCLAHLSNNNIFKAVNNFVASGSKYLLATSYAEHMENTDIVTGGWRKNNFLLPPFNFPKPVYRIDEKPPGRDADKVLLMWELKELGKYL